MQIISKIQNEKGGKKFMKKVVKEEETSEEK